MTFLDNLTLFAIVSTLMLIMFLLGRDNGRRGK
jgi:hypothetical protein